MPDALRSPVRHVVLVVFDTLRKDAVGAYGERPDWGPDFPAVTTPKLDGFAAESVRFTRAYPESLPTLPARRALYTGQRTYPFHNGRFRLKGDFVPAAGWGPIPEEQHTLAEIFGAEGFRTGLVSDLYHQFKPSKNFWRGFDEWQFIRGQETDPSRSGPKPSQAELDRWVPRELRELRNAELDRAGLMPTNRTDWFSSRILRNMHDRVAEQDWFNALVMRGAARWLEQNADARTAGERVFLTVESFDPHEPWFVPEPYRRRYDDSDGREQVISPYAEVDLPDELLRRTRANYAGLVTMTDRWFGHLLEQLRVGGWLDDTLVVVASDHGHSLGEHGYIGKRQYPSEPEVVDVPLLVRFPDGRGAGTVHDGWVQFHDVAATVLDAAGLDAPEPLDGRSFLDAAVAGGERIRDAAVVGWSNAVTVVTEQWWLNAKVDGTGAFLRPRDGVQVASTDMTRNLAEDRPEVVQELFARAVSEAGGSFPQFLLDEAAGAADAPGCSPLAAAR
ncbi:sulfatase [Jatrophihabitans endophyticus]|uniref:sulfatase n=1 Tax=Jatrophihabitans endophyticus TaxID=1206085 RepID=UPI0019E09195|nr:sulfatase [Jatrophihabitans endophyticus]MBE7187091.1 sulfatase [Jatrophihabitans endophyticus]